jgi:hypothetical protein
MRRAAPGRARSPPAVAEAVATADARDVILLAGKGHEPYQEIAGVRHAYSDLDAQSRRWRHGRHDAPAEAGASIGVPHQGESMPSSMRSVPTRAR